MRWKTLRGLLVLTAVAGVSYFSGRMLSSSDLGAEQEYSRRLRLRLELDDGQGFNMWTQVSNLRAFGPDDRVFTVDSGTGQLVFGDGVHGRRPPAEEGTVMARYRLSRPA